MRIRLVCDDGLGNRHYRPPSFILAIEDGEATILREGAALVDRDRSATLVCGSEPETVGLVLRVEALQ